MSENTRLRPAIDPGNADFAALREQHFYYVDKTSWLPQFIGTGAGPVLITRPRRFGKTLFMDTLRRFLELNYPAPDDRSATLGWFEGLAVSGQREFCAQHQGRYPVIAVTFKDVRGRDFEGARDMLCQTLVAAYGHTSFLEHEQRLDERRRRAYGSYLELDDPRTPPRSHLIKNALAFLAQCLHAAYGSPVYILIDEYDVPLYHAWVHGYYEEMVDLIGGLLSAVLKPAADVSRAIQRCIQTGCLHVAQESIFTGANNLQVLGLSQRRCATALGFTAAEVAGMLAHFELSAMAEQVRSWYDGYTIGGVSGMYCPWSIAMYCHEASAPPVLPEEDGGRGMAATPPRPYWVNTSGNEVLRELAATLSAEGLQDLQDLLHGQTLQLQVRDCLTYGSLRRRTDDDAFFSLLYHTGYLTGTPVPGTSELQLRIPNAEVHQCYDVQLQDYFGLVPRRDAARFTAFIEHLAAGQAQEAAETLTEILTRHLDLSMMRAGAPAGAAEAAEGQLRERVYQLLVHMGLCLLSGAQVRLCAMERALGEGRCDECFVFTRHRGLGCILEFKVAAADDEETLERTAAAALAQIESRRYAAGLLGDPDLGVSRVQAYGIACIRKRCRMIGRCCTRAAP